MIGATHEQAEFYVGQLRTFERMSNGSGDHHHALPRNCGWWKRFAKAKWNLVRLSPKLHVAAHAVLSSIFPDNDALTPRRGVDGCLSEASGVSSEKAQTRHRRWIQKRGQAAYQLAKKYEASPSAITVLVTRRVGRQDARTRKPSCLLEWLRMLSKKPITSAYNSGKSATEIAKEFGLDKSTVLDWLREWEAPIRSAQHTKMGFDRSKEIKKIRKLRKQGLSPHRIAKLYNTTSKMITGWLGEKTSHSEGQHSRYHVRQGINNPDCKFCHKQRAA